jgi:hypothetical protein
MQRATLHDIPDARYSEAESPIQNDEHEAEIDEPGLLFL